MKAVSLVVDISMLLSTGSICGLMILNTFRLTVLLWACIRVVLFS